ncbi:TPA: ead/Ea22-like family protein [Raoultella ornithinolytica]|nr:ead/Ea22-like family protein [Raoultella ornithinolytica]
MTTDITELAQSLKAAAENATPGEWCSDDQYGIVADAGLNGNYYIASCSGPEHRSNKRFIALANPANVLALVEALEKAQQRIAELEDAEQKLCVANVTLDARAELAERRLAEMESRTVTVKLPDYRNTYKGTFADEVEHQVRRALDLFSADAGIKWEAE